MRSPVRLLDDRAIKRDDPVQACGAAVFGKNLTPGQDAPRAGRRALRSSTDARRTGTVSQEADIDGGQGYHPPRVPGEDRAFWVASGRSRPVAVTEIGCGDGAASASSGPRLQLCYDSEQTMDPHSRRWNCLHAITAVASRWNPIWR